MKALVLVGILAAIAMAGCTRPQSAKGVESSAPIRLSGYSLQPLPDWTEATAEMKKDMEAQDAAVNASLPLQSRFQRAFRGTHGEIYMLSILEKPHTAVNPGLIDDYIKSLTLRFKTRAASSDPRSASTGAANGQLWSWHAVISGQLFYKTIYLDRDHSQAIVVDLITSQAISAEQFKRYVDLCASLQ
jgi:hypothetical protein